MVPCAQLMALLAEAPPLAAPAEDSDELEEPPQAVKARRPPRPTTAMRAVVVKVTGVLSMGYSDGSWWCAATLGGLGDGTTATRQTLYEPSWKHLPWVSTRELPLTSAAPAVVRHPGGTPPRAPLDAAGAIGLSASRRRRRWM